MLGRTTGEPQSADFDPHGTPLVLNGQRPAFVPDGTCLCILENAPAPADALAYDGTCLVAKKAPVPPSLSVSHSPRRAIGVQNNEAVVRRQHLLPAFPTLSAGLSTDLLAECATIDFAVFATIEIHSFPSAPVVGLSKNDEAFAPRDVFDAVLGVVGVTADEATQSILDMRCYNGAGIVLTADQRVLVAPGQPRRLRTDSARRPLGKVRG